MFPSNPKESQQEGGMSDSVVSVGVQRCFCALRGRTLQHRQVHGVVGFLRDAEHYFQAVLDLTFTFLTTCQQLLRKTDANSILMNSTSRVMEFLCLFRYIAI